MTPGLLPVLSHSVYEAPCAQLDIQPKGCAQVIFSTAVCVRSKAAFRRLLRSDTAILNKMVKTRLMCSVNMYKRRRKSSGFENVKLQDALEVFIWCGFLPAVIT